MNKFFQWIIGISIILLVGTFVLSALVPLFVPSLRGTATMPHAWMMGGGEHMFGGRGMMDGGFMRGGFSIGMFLFPLLFIGAAVWGVTWLVRSLPPDAQPPAPALTQPCAHCGQPLQAGWKACPYCGEKTT